MKSTMTSTTHKNNSDSPIKNNETGGVGAYLARVGGRRALGFVAGTCGKETPWKTKVILKQIQNRARERGLY
jgi:hypothetical protein